MTSLSNLNHQPHLQLRQPFHRTSKCNNRTSNAGRGLSALPSAIKASHFVPIQIPDPTMHKCINANITIGFTLQPSITPRHHHHTTKQPLNEDMYVKMKSETATSKMKEKGRNSPREERRRKGDRVENMKCDK